MGLYLTTCLSICVYLSTNLLFGQRRFPAKYLYPFRGLIDSWKGYQVVSLNTFFQYVAIVGWVCGMPPPEFLG